MGDALEARGVDVVHLEIGQPDFKTPRNIIESAYKAMNDGYTGYTGNAGLPEARRAIAEYCARRKNITASPEEVVIVPCGKPVVFFALLMLIEAGDEVIIPDPGFPIYRSVVEFAGGKPVSMPLLEENDFRPDLAALRNAITDKTKLLILNSPSNPTGGVLCREDITAIADMIRDTDIFVLSDEIYDRIFFGEKPVSIAAIDGMKERTILLDGFSKSYAMTGWRLGYGVMNRVLADQMTLLMANSNSCAASFAQIAGIEALNGPQDEVEKMTAAFRERRDLMVAGLNAVEGISCRVPMGAFYAFPNISSFGLSSTEFSDRLLGEYGVATLAGASFGKCGEGYIRISCANSLENLERALTRINEFARALKGE
jgi:aspartate/methionine/tyrosine aminotransferase